MCADSSLTNKEKQECEESAKSFGASLGKLFLAMGLEELKKEP